MTQPGVRAYVLAHLTLLDVPPPDLVSLAAEAGYDGVTLDISVPESGVDREVRYPMLAGSPMLRETLARVRDTGIVVKDVQAARLNAGLRLEALGPFFEAAQALGARYLMTVSDESDPARAAERIGALADAAAPFGLTPVLEFMVYGGVKTLAAANAVLDLAARPNLAIMVDTLHLCRGGDGAPELAAVDLRRVPYIQICDAKAGPGPRGTEALRAEALTDRRFPGDGVLPLADLLAALPHDITLSIEAPVASMPMPPTAAGRAALALARTKAVVHRSQSLRALSARVEAS